MYSSPETPLNPLSRKDLPAHRLVQCMVTIFCPNSEFRLIPTQPKISEPRSPLERGRGCVFSSQNSECLSISSLPKISEPHSPLERGRGCVLFSCHISERSYFEINVKNTEPHSPLERGRGCVLYPAISPNPDQFHPSPDIPLNPLSRKDLPPQRLINGGDNFYEPTDSGNKNPFQ